MFPTIIQNILKYLCLSTLFGFIQQIAAIDGVAPIALHQLVSVNTAGNAVIRLKGWDNHNPKMTYTVTSLPTTGELYQLSQVYSDHGIEPKAGVALMTGSSALNSNQNVPQTVTGSNNRLYYKRPNPDVATNIRWDTFTFTVHNGYMPSYTGTVTVVPSNGALIGSNFLLSNEGWTIIGNKATTATSAAYEPYSRGATLNHYVLGSDDKIHLVGAGVNGGVTGKTDSSLWYFHAPMNYYSNYGIAYGGKLSFTIGAFSGDFSDAVLNNPSTTSVVEIECATCIGPVTTGIKLSFRLSTLLAKQKLNTGASGATTTFTIDLTETSGWLKDSQDTLISAWVAPTKCDFIQVLSAISSINILGDWTNWYETVALDNVAITANIKDIDIKGGIMIPICAQKRPDASVCTCA